MRHLLLLNERDLHHPNSGGAEVNLFEVAERLVERGYRATLLCVHFPGARHEEVVRGVRVLRTGGIPSYYGRLPLLVRRALEPDTAIVEHLCKLPFLTPLYTRHPVVAVTHHLFGRTAFQQVAAPIALGVVAAERLIPWVYRRCSFIAVSPSTRDDLIARGLRPEQIRVIPNGVDCRHYTPPAAEPGPPPRILAFGRIEPYKRFDLVLQAFLRLRAEIPDATLAIVGGGTGLDAVRADIRRHGLGAAVQCPGPVDERDKVRHIREAHLVLNASEKEGWGLTVVEAGACARPTIASDVPGLRDAVIDGETGLLVPHGDVEALAAAAVRLLRDEPLRLRLGAQARSWAERFSWDGVAEATAACIEEACGAPAAATAPTWFASGEARRNPGL